MPGDNQLTEKIKTANCHLFFRFSRNCKKEIVKRRKRHLGMPLYLFANFPLPFICKRFYATESSLHNSELVGNE